MRSMLRVAAAASELGTAKDISRSTDAARTARVIAVGGMARSVAILSMIALRTGSVKSSTAPDATSDVVTV